MSDEPVVAIGLLTQTHLTYLKDCLPQVYHVAENDSFQDLLRKLDLADNRSVWDARRESPAAGPSWQI